MSLLLIILIVVLLFGGGGGFYGFNRGYYGAAPFGGLLGFLVLLIVLFFLFGRGPATTGL